MGGDRSEKDNDDSKSCQNPARGISSGYRRTGPMTAHQQIHAKPSSALSCAQYVKSRLAVPLSEKPEIVYTEKSAHLQSRPPPSPAVIAAAPAVQKIHVNVRLAKDSAVRIGGMAIADAH